MPDPNQQNSQNPNPQAVPPVGQQNIPLIPDTASSSPEATDYSSQPNDPGSAAPNDIPPIVTPPKKKFGGGRIIATILGILLLVGGIGAGLVLTQQQQLFQQKAGGYCTSNSQCASGKCVNGVCINQCTSNNNCPVGSQCKGGECVPKTNTCDAPNIICGGACVNPNNDNGNCGGCAVSCGTGTCVAGKCQGGQQTCQPNQTSCSTAGGSACVNLQTDSNNCGTCGHSCSFGASCTSGQCQAPGGGTCNGVCIGKASDCSVSNYGTGTGPGTGSCSSALNTYCCKPGVPPVISCYDTKGNINCPSGYSCNNKGVCVPPNAGNGTPCSPSGPSACANGYSCINSICTPNTSGGCKIGDAGAPVCCTDSSCTGGTKVCEKPARYECNTGGVFCTLEVNSSSCQGSGGGGTPPPGANAQCTSVTAYDSSWKPLTSAQLSSVKAGQSINFCVGGNTTGGGFDMAKFTINSAAQAQITTKGSGAAAALFCQAYTIPAGVASFNVTAQIHDSTLGWSN